MTKNILSKGLNIWQVLILFLFYILLKFLLVIGLSEILVHFIEDISLEIELGEFLSAVITLFLCLLFYKKLNLEANSQLSFPKIKFIFLIIILVIGFRLLEDPFYRFENIFFDKPPFNPSEIHKMDFSLPIAFRAFSIILLVPIFEELFFRKIIFESLIKKYSNLWLAIIISSVLFALTHLSITSFLPKLLFGFIAAYIFYKTNNIWHPIIFHIFSNLIWFAIFINPKIYWTILENLDFKISYWLYVIFGLGLVLVSISHYKKIK